MDITTRLTVENLDVGIRAFKARAEWALDLHASLYDVLRSSLEAGVTPAWWRRTVDRLAAWRAIRPDTKGEIMAEGLKELQALSSAYSKLVGRHGTVDLGNADWSEAEELFAVAHRIKETVRQAKTGKQFTSYVFSSKLCHFMFPSIYIVVDNAAMGGCTDYGLMWRGCQSLWCSNVTPRNELKAALAKHTGPANEFYPWATKIVELCIVAHHVERQRKPFTNHSASQ